MTAFAPKDGRCLRRPGSAGRVLRQASLAGATVALLGAASTSAWAARCSDPITIVQNQQIDYGTIVVSTSAGTVRITPGGAVSTPAGFALLSGGAAGQFQVTGKKDCNVTISFVAGSLIGPPSSTAMTITNFTTNAGTAPGFDHNGNLNFAVGADLLVNANQLGGTYNGVYTITVVY
jgi:hypothetical protein